MVWILVEVVGGGPPRSCSFGLDGDHVRVGHGAGLEETVLLLVIVILVKTTAIPIRLVQITMAALSLHLLLQATLVVTLNLYVNVPMTVLFRT